MSCEPADWTSSRPVGRSAPSWIRFPQVVELPAGLGVIGNAIRLFDTTVVPFRPVAGTAIEGRLPDWPPGDFEFVYPRVVRAGQATWLFWGEKRFPLRPTALQWVASPVTELWASRVGNGRWTNPVRVLQGRRLRWDPSTGIAVFQGDSLSALAVTTIAAGHSRMVMVYVSSDAVTPHVAPFAGVYGSPVRSGDEWVLFYVDAFTDEASANRLYARRTKGPGAEWSAPEPLNLTGSGEAYELRALSDGNMVHLVWSQRDATGATAIRYAVSSDDGRSWVGRPDLRVKAPPGLTAFRPQLDSRGLLHVMFEDWSAGAENKMVAYARATATGWSAPSTVFPDQRSGGFDFRILRNGRMVATMIAQKRSDPSDAAPRTIYAECRAAQRLNGSKGKR